MTNPIGIFDSGVGGLTVLAQIANRAPSESIVYLGDTARVPYGTKSPDTVIRYARNCAKVLLEYDIKLLVVACNTASAFALPALQDTLDIPVIGVVEPGARRATEVTRTGRIGVIGTAGTIDSHAYPTAISAYAPDATVVCKACPLFVPLAEEGWTEGDVPEQVARTYLTALLEEGIDTLVLGCTHYPLLKPAISRVAGDSVTLVDSAESTSEAVGDVLHAARLEAPEGQRPEFTCLVTDDPASFANIGRRFIGHDLDRVDWVDV